MANAQKLQGPQSPLRSFLGSIGTEIGLLIAITIVVGLTIWIDETRQYLENPAQIFSEIIRHASILGIFAMGAGIVIIAGGIDLSSGSVIAMSGTVCCSVILALSPLKNDAPWTQDLPAYVVPVAIVATLVVGFIVGSLHTWLITVIKLPPFIATLASLVGLRSLARVLIQDVNGALTPNRNTQIYVRDDFFRGLGQNWEIPFFLCIAIGVTLFLLLSRTVVGRHLYAIGGNEEAARLSGIRTDRVKWLAYCIGTTTASVAGILYAAEIGAATPVQAGLGYELNAIAASVVGGCSLQGGIGTISGIMLGALFLRTVIDSVARTVKNNPDEFQGMIVGLLVVLAVTFNELRSQQKGRKQFFPGALGIVNIVALTLLMGLVGSLVSTEGKAMAGLATGAATGLILAVRKVIESRSTTGSAS